METTSSAGGVSTTLSAPPHNHDLSGATVGSAGGGQPVSTAQPSLGLMYIIALEVTDGRNGLKKNRLTD